MPLTRLLSCYYIHVKKQKKNTEIQEFVYVLYKVINKSTLTFGIQNNGEQMN